jgi:hypothetical protein
VVVCAVVAISGGTAAAEVGLSDIGIEGEVAWGMSEWEIMERLPDAKREGGFVQALVAHRRVCGAPAALIFRLSDDGLYAVDIKFSFKITEKKVARLYDRVRERLSKRHGEPALTSPSSGLDAIERGEAVIERTRKSGKSLGLAWENESSRVLLLVVPSGERKRGTTLGVGFLSRELYLESKEAERQ